jgi:hypothetical protein
MVSRQSSRTCTAQKHRGRAHPSQELHSPLPMQCQTSASCGFVSRSARRASERQHDEREQGGRPGSEKSDRVSIGQA